MIILKSILVEELEEEGKHAIDGPLCKPVIETLPANDYLMGIIINLN